MARLPNQIQWRVKFLGGLIGPILFILYITDIFELKLNANLIAVAEDSIRYADVSQLKKHAFDILLIQECCIINEMQRNVEKCAVIHFGSHNPNFSYLLYKCLLTSLQMLSGFLFLIIMI